MAIFRYKKKHFLCKAYNKVKLSNFFFRFVNTVLDFRQYCRSLFFQKKLGLQFALFGFVHKYLYLLLKSSSVMSVSMSSLTDSFEFESSSLNQNIVKKE